MKTFRAFVLLATACAMLAGCGLFKGSKKSEDEEKSGRVNMSIADQKLAADPTLAATTVTLPPPVAAKDWPQLGINADKITGHLDAARELKVDWRINIGAGSSLTKRLVAPPVVADGRLYTIDADQRVAAFDAKNGHRIWTHELKAVHKKDNHAIGGGLAIAGDKVLVSSGYGYLAALSTQDGKEIWRRRTDSPLSGSPAVFNGHAYFTSTDNQVYSVNLENGVVDWSDQAITESARILSAPSPAVTADLLVAPYSSGELIAYLPGNGRRLWQDTLTTVGRFTPLSAINDIAGRPSIENGVVYAASHSGVLTAIDARSGQRLWAILFGSRSGPVLAGDFIFIVGVEGQVACLQKTDGKVVWVRSLPEFKDEKHHKKRIVWTGPLLATNRLIVTSSQGEVLALSPQTGETVGQLKVGGEDTQLLIEPIAAEGHIYILTDKAQLIAIK